MTNTKGELITSIPAKCKNYAPQKDKSSGVKCEKLGILYECKNHKGQKKGCLFCERFCMKMQ